MKADAIRLFYAGSEVVKMDAERARWLADQLNHFADVVDGKVNLGGKDHTYAYESKYRPCFHVEAHYS